MDDLVIGMGEIGRAIQSIFRCEGIGRNDKPAGKDYDVLHICFPYSEEFETQVSSYQALYNPKFTIIHSTVPVGINRILGSISSPCRGIHPELELGIRTFPKILAGEQASLVADHFRKVGLKVILYDEPETGEAAKLFDTEYYRACIQFAQRVKKYCELHQLNFSEVYTIPNITYNEGYTKLDHPEYVRPVLQPIMTEIGGHCVGNNKVLISMSEGL